MNTRKISKAFDEVALLTRAIELSVTRYADGDEGTSTAIDTHHQPGRQPRRPRDR